VHIAPDVPSHTYTSTLLQDLKTEKLLSKTSAIDLLATFNSIRQHQLTGTEAEMQHILSSTNGNEAKATNAAAYRKAIEVGLMLKRKLNLVSEKPYLLVNGRVCVILFITHPSLSLTITKLIGPLPAHSFMAADFPALVEFEVKRRIQPAIQALQNSTLMDNASRSVEGDKSLVYSHAHFNDVRVTRADVISSVSSIVAAAQIADPAEQGILQRPQAPRNRYYNKLSGNHT
jgi:UDP-glucose:glycoprotein glucosyltransferase